VMIINHGIATARPQARFQSSRRRQSQLVGYYACVTPLFDSVMVRDTFSSGGMR
jgi:hypothetical protein